MHAVGGDALSGFKVECYPRLGHPAEGHFLNGLAGGRVHDGCDNCHAAPIAGMSSSCPARAQPILHVVTADSRQRVAIQTIFEGCPVS